MLDNNQRIINLKLGISDEEYQQYSQLNSQDINELNLQGRLIVNKDKGVYGDQFQKVINNMLGVTDDSFEKYGG